MPDRAAEATDPDGAVASSRSRVSFADVLLVGLGTGFGAVARYGVEGAVGLGWGALWLVNVIGSALLGVLVGAVATRRVSLVMGAGFLGGFTTFSSAAVAALPSLAGVGLLVGLSVICALAAAVGWWVGRRALR